MGRSQDFPHPATHPKTHLSMKRLRPSGAQDPFFACTFMSLGDKLVIILEAVSHFSKFSSPHFLFSPASEHVLSCLSMYVVTSSFCFYLCFPTCWCLSSVCVSLSLFLPLCILLCLSIQASLCPTFCAFSFFLSGASFLGPYSNLGSRYPLFLKSAPLTYYV